MFLILSRSLLLRTKNISETSCRENQNTHFVFNNVFLFFRKSCRLLIWKKTWLKPDRPHMTIWRMRIARWITEAANTHSEYVTLSAFPLQQRLHERASMLRYTYSLSVCLSVCPVDVTQYVTPKCTKNYSPPDWVLLPYTDTHFRLQTLTSVYRHSLPFTDTHFLSKVCHVSFYGTFTQSNQIL